MSFINMSNQPPPEGLADIVRRILSWECSGFAQRPEDILQLYEQIMVLRGTIHLDNLAALACIDSLLSRLYALWAVAEYP